MNIVVMQRENPAEVELEYVEADYAHDQDTESKSDEFIEDADHHKPTATLANIRRFRFSLDHDLLLLRQAIETQAFMAPHGRTEAAWSEVQQALKEQTGLNLEVRTARERFMLLLKKYESGEIHTLKRRGTTEGQELMEELLAQILEMKTNYQLQRKMRKNSSTWRNDSSNGAKRKRVYVTEGGETYVTSEADETAAVNTSVTEAAEFGNDAALEDSASSAKRVKKISLLDLLAESHARRKAEVDNERLRLEVESERLRLEAERLRIEEKRIDMEAKQREEERRMQSENLRTILQTVFDYMKKK